jgi:hypothetical protein
MIAEGLVKEGVAIVAAARARYDGHVRNPFNEYECGSYYARAMASYALLPAYAGFGYSAVTRALKLDPKTEKRPFRTFFSTAGAYGTIEVSRTAVTVRVLEGQLRIEQLVLAGKAVACGETATSEREVVVAMGGSKRRRGGKG